MGAVDHPEESGTIPFLVQLVAQLAQVSLFASFSHLCQVQLVQQIKLKLIKRWTKMDKFKYLVGKCI